MREVTRLTLTKDTALPSIEVVGGLAGDVQEAIRICEIHGLQSTRPGRVRFILDLPVGFALTTLMHQHTHQPTVVRTWNTSLAYCADLWDLHPTVLLSNTSLHLVAAVCNAALDEPYCEPAIDQLQLTKAERRILQHVALGLSNKDIATTLSMREQTIANSVTRILEKLQLSSRSAAVLYYWGVQSSNIIDLLMQDDNCHPTQ